MPASPDQRSLSCSSRSRALLRSPEAMDRETADEIKRYVKILYEDIGQKIQLLAEGQQVVLQKSKGSSKG